MSEQIDFAEAARDLAWKYFALHANQRLDVFKSYLTLLAILFAGFGVAFQISNYLLGMFLAVFSFIAAILFYLLDLRTRELIKTCENYLKLDERELAANLNRPEIKLFEMSDRLSDTSFKGWFRRSYGRILDIFFVVMACSSLVVASLFLHLRLQSAPLSALVNH